MRILVDMNLSPRWVRLLESNGFTACHWSEKGSPAATDAEIMAYAAAEDFVVLTQDLDFGSILAVTHGSKPSVVQIRSENLDPDFIGGSVILALHQMQHELESGALITIDTKRTRLRILPLFQ